MTTVVKERLDTAMQKENIDIKSFNYATREGMYNTLINGPATDQDIKDAASLLGCATEYLLGSDMIVNGTKRKINSVRLIGSRVKDMISRAHWSVPSLHAYTGIPKGTIYYITNNDDYASLDAAESLAYGLNCSVEYLQGETDNPARYVNYKLADKYKKQRMFCGINSSHINAYMARNNITCSELADAIKCPEFIIKKCEKMQSVSFPEPSAKKLDKLMANDLAQKEITSAKRSGRFNKSSGPNVPVEEHKLLKEKEHVDKISTPLTRSYFEQKAQDKIDAEARKEQVKKYFGGMVMKETKEAANTTYEIPSGSISIKQLLTIATIADKNPDLLDLFSDITGLDKEDYDKLTGQIRWMVDTLKKNA